MVIVLLISVSVKSHFMCAIKSGLPSVNGGNGALFGLFRVIVILQVGACNNNLVSNLPEEQKFKFELADRNPNLV